MRDIDRLKDVLLQRMASPGKYDTGVEGFFLSRRDETGLVEQGLHTPSIGLVVQGEKRSLVGSGEIVHKEGQCFAISVDMLGSCFVSRQAGTRLFLPLFLPGYLRGFPAGGKGSRGRQRAEFRQRRCLRGGGCALAERLFAFDGAFRRGRRGLSGRACRTGNLLSAAYGALGEQHPKSFSVRHQRKSNSRSHCLDAGELCAAAAH